MIWWLIGIALAAAVFALIPSCRDREWAEFINRIHDEIEAGREHTGNE
jgi:hypothetical protein